MRHKPDYGANHAQETLRRAKLWGWKEGKHETTPPPPPKPKPKRKKR